MPEVIAIHWEKKRLRIAEASIGATVRLSESLVVDVPETLTGVWLKETLRRKGISARQAIVCLPRDEAILRQLELPDAPDEELPALVQFQASTRSTTPLDQLVLDFLPMPRRPGSVQRDVLLATVPRTTADQIRGLLADAGIELTVLTLTSFGLAELALRADAGDGGHSCLVVYPDSNRLEVVLLTDQQPIAAHLVRPPLDDSGRPQITKAAADLSRVLVPAQPWLAEHPIARIVVLGSSSEWEGLEQALRDRWNCPVERLEAREAARIRDLDLSTLSEPFDLLVPPLGALLGRLRPLAPPFDLLHPRQPRPRQDPRKLYYAVGSAAALLVVALFSSWYLLSLQSLDNQITTARDQVRKATSDEKAQAPTKLAADLIEDWKTRDINQLQQLGDLYELMQGTERILIADYDFTPAQGAVLAKLHIIGNARERVDWQQLAQRMADAGRFRVKPRDVSQQSRDPDYESRFELDADLQPVKATAPATPAPDSAKAR